MEKMEFGDSDSRRRSVRCKHRLSRIVWDISSESKRCHQLHLRGLERYVTNGVSMSKVILLSVVVASICSIVASASQQQVSTIASQAVHRSTSDAETNTLNLSADIKQTRQQHQPNITTDRCDNQGKPQAVDEEREPDLISSSTPEALSTTPLAPPNYSTQPSTVATSSQSTITPANLVPSASISPSHVGYAKLVNENGGDLSASSSVHIQSSQPLQSKKSSQLAGGGNRWSQHFGARLRPLTPNGLIDHEAAPSSKATAALASDARGFNRPPLNQQQLAARQQSGFVGQPFTGNSVDNKEDNKNQEEDYDDDSEALLYKMMQQQNFLMNPIFQEQPTSSNQQQLAGGGNRPEGQAQQRGQAPANGIGQVQQNDDLASSKKVIKLLKSYSHIHQVDDSDDQIRGTYTRLSSYRPNDGQMSSKDQYSSGISGGNHNNAHNGNRRPINGQSNSGGQQRPHVFVSSRPVTTSQSREQGVRIAAAHQPHADGNYRQAASAHRDKSYPGNQQHPGNQDGGSPPLDGSVLQDGNESGANGSGPPPQEEEEFECPNNGIFADVASGCQAYHVCQSGAQVQERFNCPLGTLFNDIILTCDFAHNVQCGKKPGDQAPQPAGLQNADPTYNRQPTQQYQQRDAPRPQQVTLPAGGYPRQPPEDQQANARPASQGPRQLVIGAGGGSPYNQHNRRHNQQASSQTAALGSYPAVKPLSNALTDAENDEDNDSEPLVPVALPPRAASTPQVTGATGPRLPYKAPPAPPASARPSQQQQSNSDNMPTSIQQQIPHQANRQSAHFSQYPPMQAQFYQRPAQLPNRYVTEASAPARTYGEPNSRPTESSVAAPSPPSVPAVGSGSDGSDNQSFNLIINHLTPAHPVEQKPQHQQQPTIVHSKPQEEPQQPQAYPAQKVTPVYKSQISAERQQSRRLVAASYPIGPQQQPPAQKHHRTPEPQNVAVPNQQQQHQNFQLQQQSGTQRQKLPSNSDQKYESQRRNNQNNNHHQQSKHKPQASIDEAHHNPRAPMTTPVYANEVASATQRSVSHSSNVATPPREQSYVNGLVDLTNGQQSSVGSENLNNGLLLIVRHSSGGPTLQVQNGFAPSSAAAPKSVAYAVDPKIINPNSPVDSQLFPNVQQFVAEHHHHHHHHQGRAAGSVTQASTNRVAHADPAPAPQTGRYPIVAGALPAMTPPEPPLEDERQQHDHKHVGGGGNAGEQYGAASDQHHHQRSAAGAIVSAASSSSPSSVAKNTQTSPQESVAALTRQKPAASNKKIQHQQQQQTSRTKRTKSSKPPAQLPKKLEKRTTSTSTTSTTSATPISAGKATTTNAFTTNSAPPNHATSDNKRNQQTLSRGGN